VLLDRQEPQELDRLGLQALRVGKALRVQREFLELTELQAPQVLQESLELMAQLVLQEPLVDKVAQERQELKVQQELLV
jgi:hypothetical protein